VLRLPFHREMRAGRAYFQGDIPLADETPGGTLVTDFPGMERRTIETLTYADLAASAKIILSEVEWRKRPVRKGAPPDAGHRVTLARWTVMKQVKPSTARSICFLLQDSERTWRPVAIGAKPLNSEIGANRRSEGGQSMSAVPKYFRHQLVPLSLIAMALRRGRCTPFLLSDAIDKAPSKVKSYGR
jgi:hypothetical protein